MLLPVVAALLAVVAICMMFVPAVVRASSLSDKLNITYTGAQVTFGYKEANTGIEIFVFSFMNFLPYLLLVAGIVFSVLSVLGKLGKIAPFVSAVCYLAAGILFFCVTKMVVYPTDSKDIADMFKEGLSLGAGAILRDFFRFSPHSVRRLRSSLKNNFSKQRLRRVPVKARGVFVFCQ